MSKIRAAVVGVVAAVVVSAGALAQNARSSAPRCEAPEYFGLCNPYVPGIRIAPSPDGKAIVVVDTWPDGPAETAGICRADRVIAVNGVPVEGHTWNETLRQIMSPSDAPIDVKVRRGNQEQEFRFGRARETDLARLSHEKFMLERTPFWGTRPGLEPVDETPEELDELSRFYDAIDQRLGFESVDGIEVPQGTPEKQAEELAELLRAPHEGGRVVGETRLTIAPNSSVPGFSALILRGPAEVVVDEVLPGSPAHKAGLFPGDRLLEVNGHPVAGLDENKLSDLILNPDEPREIVLKIRRGGSDIDLSLRTQSYEAFGTRRAFEDLPQSSKPLASTSYVLGLHALYPEAPLEAMVDYVDYPSPAFDAGVHPGDRILSVGGKAVAEFSREELNQALEPDGPSDLNLELSRLGKKMTAHIKPATYADVQARIGRKITKKGPTPKHCPGD